MLFNSILDRVDHYVRHQPVQFACNLRLQISVHVLVVYRGIPFLSLAVPALLHVEEADVDRIAQLDACAVRVGEVVQRLRELAAPLPVCRGSDLALVGQEPCRLILEERAYLMFELVRNHTAKLYKISS